MSTTSPAGDEVRLVAAHVHATVQQLERRIQARFGERGLTKAARDLGQLVTIVQSTAGQSQIRVRRTTVTTRTFSVLIVASTVFLLGYSLRAAIVHGLEQPAGWVPLLESVINDLVFAAIAVVSPWAFPERFERRTLLRLLHRLPSLAHVIDMHRLSKDPKQVMPTYVRTTQSVSHGLDADQLHPYLDYCSEMLSLTAKTAALCAEDSSDDVVLNTVSTRETLTTELSNKIWQKISLLPRTDTVAQ